MGAPTTAKKRTRKAAAQRGPVVSTVDGVDFTDEDIARMEAETDALFQEVPDSPIGPDGEIRPVEVGRAGKAGPDMTHIFTVDGQKYFVPKTPHPAIMLRFMREVRDKRVGRDAAIENAMMAMLGKKRLDALCEADEVTDEDVANVFIIVGHILFTAIKRWRTRVDPALDPS